MICPGLLPRPLWCRVQFHLSKPIVLPEAFQTQVLPPGPQSPSLEVKEGQVFLPGAQLGCGSAWSSTLCPRSAACQTQGNVHACCGITWQCLLPAPPLLSSSPLDSVSSPASVPLLIPLSGWMSAFHSSKAPLKYNSFLQEASNFRLSLPALCHTSSLPSGCKSPSSPVATTLPAGPLDTASFCNQPRLTKAELLILGMLIVLGPGASL